MGAGALADKVALITGAGSGIGRATAKRFAEEGAAVMCADIDGEAARRTAESLAGDGARAAALQLDVTDRSAVEKSLRQTLDTLGGFDVLFNNAGIGIGSFDHTLAVNLSGVFYGLQHGAEIMAERGGGAIVNTASIAGLQALVGPVQVGDVPVGEGEARGGDGMAYTASKHAVVGLTRQYAVSYGTRGVRVNAVAPGYIVTPMSDPIRRDPAIARSYEKLHPMGRLGRAEEVADAVVYLASDRASFVTGVILPVDGGYSAR